MVSVLGISLGTRSLGIALMRNKHLIDCRVKTFTDAWSKKKVKNITDTIEKIIITQGITDIAIKLSDPVRTSVRNVELLESIEAMAQSYNILTSHYYLDDIKSFCDKKPNKQGVAEYFSQKYPHLKVDFCKEMKNGKGYYIKMFEAIAVAHLFIQ